MGFIKVISIIGGLLVALLFVVPLVITLFLSGAINQLFIPEHVVKEEKLTRSSYYGDSWEVPAGWTIISYDFEYTAPSLSGLSGSSGLARILGSNNNPKELDQILRSSLPTGARLGRSSWFTDTNWPEIAGESLLGYLTICGPELSETRLRYYDLEVRPKPVDAISLKVRERGLRYTAHMTMFGKFFAGDGCEIK